MKPRLLFLLFLCSAFSAFAQRDYTTLVNPFIGTGGHGHTYPGASMPFGMMQLSPDTRMADWDGSSGYHYSDSVIYGFSHTHLSGTGVPDYCDLLFMPFSGPVQWKNTAYRSRFSHKNEKAAPGYYEVLLDKGSIRAQLTAATRSGMHQYTFPAGSTNGSLLIDLSHRDEVLEARLEQVDAYTVRGMRRSKSWATNQHLYFYIRFEQPILQTLMLRNGSEVSVQSAEGKDLKAALTFRLDAARQMRCRVGISGVSTEGAQRNLDAELGRKRFDQVRNEARAAWNRELGKIDVSGGTRDQQVIFYTALYHASLAPNLFQDTDGQYRGTDGNVHRATDFTNYTVFSLWDTYRALHPLMTLVNPRRTNDWIHTFLAQHEQGGMLPVWELAGNETFCMIGYHSASVIYDAWQKGIRDFDAEKALRAMVSYADSDRFGLKQYREWSFISNDREHESVSKTLEYAYDDWCIAQLARGIGNDSVYRRFIRRAQNYRNLFDPQTRHFRGKLQARWMRPFEPREINNFYTEGNAWQYGFAVPHDVQGLMELHGGAGAFASWLDSLFSAPSLTTGRDQPDVTGLIGQYAHGNEPSHHIAYLYTYAGAPWKTQELVHRIAHEFYRNAPDGLIGNEDCGQMSAWYVLSALGLYPVCPGNGDYVFGTPLFDSATIRLENGKIFRIRAQRSKPEAFYVQDVRLNGKAYPYNWILHGLITEGGTLDFRLDTRPAHQRRENTAFAPVSRIDAPRLQPMPWVENDTEKFRDSIHVRLATGGNPLIFYRIDSGAGPGIGLRYQGPFVLKQSAKLHIMVPTPGRGNRTMEQSFFKIPSDRSIRVLSTPHPLYTGGGPDALVDGITGSAQWRSGDWHSYFGTDFEGIVDLKSVRPVNRLAIHVLQDVSPWILFPSEVVFSVSDDGISFRELARFSNLTSRNLEGARVQELGGPVSGKARFIKVQARNGGLLPDNHPSAGQPSHLFIDEIIIR